MFRAKIAFIYALLVAALVASVVFLLRLDVGNLLEDGSTISLRRAAVAAEQSARLDEASLLAKAKFVADSTRLHQAMKLSAYDAPEEIPEGEEVPTDEEGKELTPTEQRHLDAYEKLLAQKYQLDEFADEAGEARNIELGLLERRPHSYDIFFVVDREGVGVAALGKDLYSWFGQDVGEEFSIVRDVIESGEPGARVAFWRWGYSAADEKRLHRVAIAPIMGTGEEKPTGAVVLGTVINDGLARRKQRVAAGLTEGEVEAATDENVLAQAPEVAFFRGDEIVGSTFSSDMQLALGSAMAEQGVLEQDEPEVLVDLTLQKNSYSALVRFFRGQVGTEKPMGIAVVSNLTAARTPLRSMTVSVVLIGVVFLLLGAGIIFAMLLKFTRPLEQLENGIQEVLAGNKDYQWEPEKGHSIQEGLAQGLNLMSAYLQGKPMPDEDAVGGGWGDLISPDGEIEDEGPGEVTGVQMPGMGGSSDSDEDDEEEEKET